MERRRPLPDAEALLAQEGFIRSIARPLVFGEGSVDDVVQETWLTALQNKPRRPASLRPWLATIARNIALGARRRDERRARRERAAARRESGEPTDELVMRVARHRQIVDAVLALEEPYRSTILLRFYDQKSTTEIAARSRISGAAVRWRLGRAFELLRAILDKEHGGDRRAWCLGLLPLVLAAQPASGSAASAGGSGALAGVAAMKAKLVIGGALALCLMATVFLAWDAMSERDPPTARNEGARGAGEPAPPAEGAEETESPSQVAPDRVDPKWADPDTAAAAARSRPVTAVAGRVRLEGGQPPLGVVVRLDRIARARDPRPRPEKRDTKTDARGDFEFEGLPAGSYEIHAAHPGFATHRVIVELAEGRNADPVDIFLSRGGALLVRVQDARGVPVSGDRVAVSTNGATLRSGVTDSQGKILFEHLEAAAYYVERPNGRGGGEGRSVTIAPGRTNEVVFQGSCTLTGEVLDVDGKPLAGATVRLTPALKRPTAAELKKGYQHYQSQTKTDPAGRFELRALPPGDYEVRVQVYEGENVYVVTVESRLTLAPGSVGERRFRLPQGTLSGRVVRADGAGPVLRHEVLLLVRRVEVSRGEVVRQLGRPVFAAMDTEGRYVFRGLRPGWYTVRAVPQNKRFREAQRLVELPREGHVKDVVFALERPRRGKLRLTVLEPDGRPATGVTFVLQKRLEDGRWNAQSWKSTGVSAGVFELELDPGAREIAVVRQGFFADPVNVIISEGTTVERHVRLRVLDESD